jgi:hypothetical protein
VKLLLNCLFFLCALAGARAQQDSAGFKPLKVFTGDIIDFTVDNLGNIYILDKGNQLKKRNATGDSVGVYNVVRRFGRLYSIDASNPLKLLLYYKDYGTIVVLDRFLNVRNTISLPAINIFQVRAICQSFDNGIWLYDEQDARLKRLNDEGVIIDQSSDFRLFMDVIPSPVQIADQDRLVYLYDPEKGVFVFDYFGTLKNRIPLPGWEDFQVLGTNVFGRRGTTLLQYQPGTLSLKEQPMPSLLEGVVKVRISTPGLYCLKDGIIKLYAF